MSKVENRLIPTIKNSIIRDMDEKYDIETIRKIMLTYTISIVAVGMLIPFGIVAFIEGNLPVGLFDLAAGLSLAANIIYLRKSGNHNFVCVFSIAVGAILYFFLLATGGVDNTAHLWCYTFPLFATFLLGSKKGFIITTLFLTVVIIFFICDFDLPYLTHYSNDFIIRFIPSFMCIFIFSCAFEYFRENAQRDLSLKNNELNITIEKLKKAETELRNAHEDLEKRVLERTIELSKANHDLRHEINEREQLEHERRILEKQLLHSQKMEAIGILAGGIAHDLNNLLSVMVSYPDLILMKLPKDSPLIKPVLTIQNSGKRAAAIVQDLLTLARRGVKTTEVTNLNQVIRHYLESPEFEELKNIHPHVIFESNLKANLFNIMGSPVHLSKSVMNLVSNAAEAMADEGKVSISTKNRYIDKPISGYDFVQEGNYVVLTISDTGIGISEDDLERIFEPFFTKKIMGRSGTGLGMAVVWGTIKDHNGYIDIESIKGKGTTFTLYFPVTKREIIEIKKPLPINEYMGNGESILIIDDVEEQREIASQILISLAYTVTSVASGEKAVEYLKNNHADLILLDMVMDPGIDGLETYQRIIKLHPHQKTIIASGFSSTNRVKEIQKIGAGAYIKKPYTFEKIGIAVKSELND